MPNDVLFQQADGFAWHRQDRAVELQLIAGWRRT
jgi:hypothetical protein